MQSCMRVCQMQEGQAEGQDVFCKFETTPFMIWYMHIALNALMSERWPVFMKHAM